MKNKCNVYGPCREKDTWICKESCPVYLKQIKNIKTKLHKHEDRYTFFCPGCRHIITINNNWKIDTKTITIKPSILSKHPRPDKPDYVCHSFITNGEIKFLCDCTHDLKNKTVPLPEFEMWDNGQSFKNPKEYPDEL